MTQRSPYLRPACAPFYFSHSFQDLEHVGIADRAGDMVDMFYTIACVRVKFLRLVHSF